MKRWIMIIASFAITTGATGQADEPANDRELLRAAAAQRELVRATPAENDAPPHRVDDVDLDSEERAARAAAHLAVARLHLVQGRKALRAEDHEAAARRAQRAILLLRQVPASLDVSEYTLQAEGILGRCAPAGVNLDAVRLEVADDPLLALRDDAQKDPHYQAGLRAAVKADEARVLVEADEARLIPDGVISYPQDWPQRVERRQAYRGGLIARSPSHVDEEGREWYVGVYDIHDLIYVPPDFPRQWKYPGEGLRDLQDRRDFWERAWSFGGQPSDVISMLHYFGGVDPIAARGPKYSLERQQEIVDMIRAFTGVEVQTTPTLPPAPR